MNKTNRPTTMSIDHLLMETYYLYLFVNRYSEDLELEDAVHTAILTLKEGFEGQMTEDNIEIGICNDGGFRWVVRGSTFLIEILTTFILDV